MKNEYLDILESNYSELGFSKIKIDKYYNSPDKEVPFVDCEDGWFELIHSSLDLVNNYVKFNKLNDFRLIKIKNKLGSLRVVCENEDDYIRGIFSMTEVISISTCENCGSNNNVKIKSLNGWLTPICDNCLNKS